MNDMPQNIFAYRFGTLYSYKLVNAPEPQLVETKSPNLGRIQVRYYFMATLNHFVIPGTVLEKFKFPQDGCETGRTAYCS